MESYERIVEAARHLKTPKKFAKHEELVNYVDERFRQENIVVPRNLARDPPFVRYGQSTNNVCEQFNAVVLKMRELPLGLCVESIIAKMTEWRAEQSREAVARAAKAAESPNQLRLHVTPSAVERVEMHIAKCNDYKVVFVELNANQFTAQVTHKERKTRHDVTIAIGDGATAPRCCATVLERMMPCAHMVAAIMAVPKNQAGPWSVFNLHLFGPVWHTATWQLQMSSMAVPFDIANEPLSRNEAIRPWQHPPQVRVFLFPRFVTDHRLPQDRAPEGA